MAKKEYGINNPKPVLLQLFCKHQYNWYRAQESFFNLSGETQYQVCEKCGKVNGTRFIHNFDGS